MRKAQRGKGHFMGRVCARKFDLPPSQYCARGQRAHGFPVAEEQVRMEVNALNKSSSLSKQTTTGGGDLSSCGSPDSCP